MAEFRNETPLWIFLDHFQRLAIEIVHLGFVVVGFDIDVRQIKCNANDNDNNDINTIKNKFDLNEKFWRDHLPPALCLKNDNDSAHNISWGHRCLHKLIEFFAAFEETNKNRPSATIVAANSSSTIQDKDQKSVIPSCTFMELAYNRNTALAPFELISIAGFILNAI